jgi:hypothetical protein
MNRYLEKIARINKPVAIGSIIGGTLGAANGYFTKSDIKGNKFVPRSKEKRILHGIAGGLGGAYLGAMVGEGYRVHKIIKDTGGYATAATRDHNLNSLYKRMGASKPFKTRKEAVDHFRKVRSMAHPDRKGGSHERMADINKAWDDFQAHPYGFTKLANAYLMKLAQINFKLNRHE